MKTVTIPTCANPFVVIVNGIKYTYPAGATVEVPDDVAEVIEQHEEAKTEPAPVQPPYSGDDILAAANAYTDKKVAEGGGGAFPVIELTTVPSTEEQMATEAENTALNAVADQSNIFVKVKYGESTPPVLLPMTAYELEGLPCFVGVLYHFGSNNVYLCLGNTGDGWLVVTMGM